MAREGMSHSDAGRLGWLASADYRTKAKSEREDEYYKDPKRCECCEQPIPYGKRFNKFCSRSCSAIVNNKKSPKRSKVSSHASCLGCGADLRGRQAKFCSNKCQQDSAWKSRKETIEASGVFPAGFGGEASRPLVKRYLVEVFGARCSICGITTWQGKEAPLIVDHIDGNALNCSIDNFRLVCGNCDMQLPTYKSKNKKGRKWRKQYSQTDV